jgi:epidermal growth factor receptor substrate 15
MVASHLYLQIWAIANQSQSGFLGRAEFYNALKLVTVAQSKRDLTPEIVKAALYGPASAQIPAPQINLTATPAPQFNSSVAAPTPQVRAVTPMSSQNLGFSGPKVPPNAGVNQQHFPSQASQLMRPPQAISASASHTTQGASIQGLPGGGTVTGPRPPNMSISSDWVGGMKGAASPGTSSQVPVSGISPSTARDEFGLETAGSTAALPPKPQATSGIKPSGPAKDSKPLNVSGNGFAFDSIFEGDVFSATSSQPKQDSSAHTISPGNLQASSTIVPVSAGTNPSVRPSALDSLQSSLTRQPGAQLQQAQSLENQNHKVPAGISLGAENSASSQSQLVWPRMTQTDFQRYSKVFVEVDKDRDGKITGEEARNLFLSWRLPRGRTIFSLCNLSLGFMPFTKSAMRFIKVCCLSYVFSLSPKQFQSFNASVIRIS